MNMNNIFEHIEKLVKSLTLDKLLKMKEEFDKVIDLIDEEVDKRRIENGEIDDLDDLMLQDELEENDDDDYSDNSFCIFDMEDI